MGSDFVGVLFIGTDIWRWWLEPFRLLKLLFNWLFFRRYVLEFLLLSPFDDSFVVLDVSFIVIRLKLLVTLFVREAKLM